VPTVGIVSPGAMGTAMGSALASGGARVVATLAGRSERTRGLAAKAQIELLDDLQAVAREAAVVLSIVPPEAAPAVARDLARAARERSATPLFADLNAVAPMTVARIAESARADGIDVVDGSISGPPPWSAGTTRLYLSGPRAAEVGRSLPELLDDPRQRDPARPAPEVDHC